MTIGTGDQGVTGEVVVVDDFKQMEGMRDRIKGRIVLFNKAMPPFHPKRGPGYGEAAPYRVAGPSKAAAMGAIATLVRSVTAHSLNSPHTGAMRYADDKKILQVKVERLVGAFEDESEEDEFNDNFLRGFLKRSLDGDDSSASESDVDDQMERNKIKNMESAREVERLVLSANEKQVEVQSELENNGGES